MHHIFIINMVCNIYCTCLYHGKCWDIFVSFAIWELGIACLWCAIPLNGVHKIGRRIVVSTSWTRHGVSCDVLFVMIIVGSGVYTLEMHIYGRTT